MQQPLEDTTGSLERAREHLYEPNTVPQSSRVPLTVPIQRVLPHAWEEGLLRRNATLLGNGTYVSQAYSLSSRFSFSLFR